MYRAIAYKFSAKRDVSKLLLCVPALMLLSSCDLAANYNKADRAANAELQDYRDVLSERTPGTDEDKQSGGTGKIPELQPYISTNQTDLKPMPLVSVSINQSVPLRDALFEMAGQAGYDIELDPRIQGSIIFTARNRPLDEVVERISDMAGLRFKIDGQSMRVEIDEPYNKIYKIDYLSVVRSNTGSVSTNVSVVSGDGADTGSSYSMNSENTSDFWTEMELNLKQILGGATTGGMKTKSDPRISSSEKTVNKKKSDTDKKDDKDSKDKSESTDGEDVSAEDEDTETEAVLRVESLPTGGDDVSGGSSASGDEKKTEFTFTLNKQAGLINVYANEKGHKLVENYLKEVKRSVSSQVLIEAKVFEVTLRDEYNTGIDWGVLGLASGEGSVGFLDSAAVSTLNSFTAGTGAHVASAASSLAAGTNFTMLYAGNDVQALVTAISGFGTVRALASPRLTVLNNQSGVLNVATNNVYFELDIDSTVDSDSGDRTTEVDSSIKSVPEGVLINVQPSVNLDNRTISMAVRPTVSRITGFEQDPAVAFVVASIPDAAGVVSNIPELNVQEIDTVVQVKSGQPIVMGGLLQDRVSSTRRGVPVLGELPMVGNAFRKHGDTIQKTELVIFLKATLLESPEDSVDDVTKDIYRRMGGDRRPYKL